MATYKPTKKWLYFTLAAMLGVMVGFVSLPSKQEYTYKQWVKELDQLAKERYQVKTNYLFDDQVYAKSSGWWSADQAVYSVTSPVSDDSEFSFDVYFTKEAFYIKSGAKWSYGERPHRLINEFSPLHQPFDWAKELLKYAEQITKSKTGAMTVYEAVFTDLKETEFRGVRLQKLKRATLTMTTENQKLTSIVFQANPIRPSDVGIFQLYPEKLSYKIKFAAETEPMPNIPDSAYLGEVIE